MRPAPPAPRPDAPWTPEALRSLAAAVLLDALAQPRRNRAFLTSSREPWRGLRRGWLEVLDLDVEVAEAAIARFVRLPWAEQRARLAALSITPTGPHRPRWDRDAAFAGAVPDDGRRLVVRE